MRKWLGLLLALLVAACGRAPGPAAQSSAGRPRLVVYTSPDVTTPQLAFWGGMQSGRIPRLFDVQVKIWKDTTQLQGLILAGKGDLWIGHVEGFARTRGRGAPVQLLAVTGWRKFFLLSTDPAIRTFDDLPAGAGIACAPPGSPAIAILESLSGTQRKRWTYPAYPAELLAARVTQCKMDTVLVGEPLATLLTHKRPGLRIVEGLEDYYGRQTGRAPRIPWAGLAIHARFAAKHPAAARELLAIIQEESARLQSNGAGALNVLPPEFGRNVPRAVLVESLQRDEILALPAAAAQAEVRAYLDLVAPELSQTVQRRPDFYFGLGAGSQP